MQYDEKATGNSNQDYRRPFGAAFLDKNIASLKDLKSAEQEHIIPVYQCQEALFPQLPENILGKKPNTYEPVPKAKGVCVGVRLLHGEIGQLKQELSILSDVTCVQKLGFPEVILPGEVRNDMYLTLVTGDFSMDRKTKNVQLTVSVIDKKGATLKDVILVGHGGPKDIVYCDTYESTIYYHTNTPKWQEMVQMKISVCMDSWCN